MPLPFSFWKPSSSISTYDVDAQAWFDALVLAGSSITTANKAAVSAFVVGCKADASPVGGVSNWAAIKEMCLLCAADSRVGAMVPVKGSAPTSNNFVDGDYLKTAGLTGGGVSKYLRTARSIDADPQDNQSVGIYVSNLPGGSSLSGRFIGSSTGGNAIEIINGSTTNGVDLRSRHQGGTLTTGTNSTGTGIVGVSRHQSTDYILRAFGSNSTQATVSGTPKGSATKMGILANDNGLNAIASTILFYWQGESVNQALLDTRGATLLAALT